MGSCEHGYAHAWPNNGLDRMDIALMFNLIKYRLQDTMCPPTKLYPEPDVSA